MSRERVWPMIRVPDSIHAEAARRQEEHAARGEVWSLWECMQEIQKERLLKKDDDWFKRMRL